MLFSGKVFQACFSSTLLLLIGWTELYSPSAQKRSSRKGLLCTDRGDKTLHCCYESGFRRCVTLQESTSLEWNSLAVTSDQTGSNEGRWGERPRPTPSITLLQLRSVSKALRLKRDFTKPNTSRGWEVTCPAPSASLLPSDSSPPSFSGWAAHSIFNYHARASGRG